MQQVTRREAREQAASRRRSSSERAPPTRGGTRRLAETKATPWRGRTDDRTESPASPHMMPKSAPKAARPLCSRDRGPGGHHDPGGRGQREAEGTATSHKEDSAPPIVEAVTPVVTGGARHSVWKGTPQTNTAVRGCGRGEGLEHDRRTAGLTGGRAARPGGEHSARGGRRRRTPPNPAEVVPGRGGSARAARLQGGRQRGGNKGGLQA